MRNRVYVTVRCPSVRLSHSFAAAACGGFAAVGPAGGIHRSTAARPAPQQHCTAANTGSATLTAARPGCVRVVGGFGLATPKVVG